MQKSSQQEKSLDDSDIYEEILWGRKDAAAEEDDAVAAKNVKSTLDVSSVLDAWFAFEREQEELLNNESSSSSEEEEDEPVSFRRKRRTRMASRENSKSKAKALAAKRKKKREALMREFCASKGVSFEDLKEILSNA